MASRNRCDKFRKAHGSSSNQPYTGDWIERATKEDLVAILDNIPCGLFVVEGPEGRTLYVNPELCDICGYDAKDVPCKKVAMELLFADKETRKRQLRYHEQMIAGLRKRPFRAEVVHQNGEMRICEERVIGLSNGKVVGVWVDVTRREAAEAELKASKKALVAAKEELESRVRARTSELTRVNAELKHSREELRLLSEYLQQRGEEERTRVAREVHDELGQLLTALKMDLAYYGAHFQEDNALLSDRLKSMEAQIDEGIDAVRRICAHLRPHVLDRLGLAAGIEWYVKGFRKRTGLKCTTIISPEIRDLDKDRALLVFRVLQETMTNIARHAQATQITVRLTQGPDGLTLKVRDNGKGISKEDTANPESFGIIGIRERIRFWGGKSIFTGGPNRGTTVSITIPLGDRSLGEPDRVRERHP